MCQSFNTLKGQPLGPNAAGCDPGTQLDCPLRSPLRRLCGISENLESAAYDLAGHAHASKVAQLFLMAEELRRKFGETFGGCRVCDPQSPAATQTL